MCVHPAGLLRTTGAGATTPKVPKQHKQFIEIQNICAKCLKGLYASTTSQDSVNFRKTAETFT